MNAALLKAIGAIASDPDSAKKALAAVCAVVIGALGVMFLPVYVLLAGFGSNATEPSDPAVKNSADLAAWARKAYFEGWGYEADAVGQMNPERGITVMHGSKEFSVYQIMIPFKVILIVFI